jgi:hypothetical protein
MESEFPEKFRSPFCHDGPMITAVQWGMQSDHPENFRAPAVASGRQSNPKQNKP